MKFEAYISAVDSALRALCTVPIDLQVSDLQAEWRTTRHVVRAQPLGDEQVTITLESTAREVLQPPYIEMRNALAAELFAEALASAIGGPG